MRWQMILLVLLLAVSLLVTACDNDDDDDNDDNDAAPSDNDVDDDDDTVDDDDDDDDVIDDDDDDDTAPPQVGKFRFDFSFEVDFEATLQMRQYLDDSVQGRFTATDGFDVIAAGTVLEGEGRLIHFPEAFGRMVVIKFQGPAVPGGKCGEQSMSYSLTLTAKEDNGYMVGGLTAYCGADTYFGKPARVLRISGVQNHEE